MTLKIIRAMGIDYGSKRIGISVSDDLGMLAHPFETIEYKNIQDVYRRIDQIIKLKNIEHIVIGIPFRVSGEEGRAVLKVRKFIKELKKNISNDIKWHEIDESFTTQDAMRKLQIAGKKSKQFKPIIDQAAAIEILQKYLDEKFNYS